MKCGNHNKVCNNESVGLGFSIFPLGFGEFGRGAIVGISEIFAVFHLISQHPAAASRMVWDYCAWLNQRISGEGGSPRGWNSFVFLAFSKNFGQIRRTDFGGHVFDQYPEDS